MELTELVGRFLSWPVPASARADDCATMQGYKGRTGTNFFTADEARHMLEYVIKPLIEEADGLEREKQIIMAGRAAACTRADEAEAKLMALRAAPGAERCNFPQPNGELCPGTFPAPRSPAQPDADMAHAEAELLRMGIRMALHLSGEELLAMSDGHLRYRAGLIPISEVTDAFLRGGSGG